MDQWKSYFTFPVFYTAVLKDNTHLNQYDAVNVLLVGNKLTGSDETLPHITPNMTSHYARGGKPISKEIVGNFLDLSPDERTLRIARARIIDQKAGAACLYRLLSSESILMDEELRQHLLQLYHYDTSAFLNESLHQSVSCPRSHLSKLDEKMIADILSYRPGDSKSDTPGNDITEENTDKKSVDDPQRDSNAAKEQDKDVESDESVETWLTENTEQNLLIRKSAIAHLFGINGAICFAQKQLSPISDRETIEKYLTVLSEVPGVISLDSSDIPEILQKFTDCESVCITELHVPMEALLTYLQRSLPSNVEFALLFVEGNIGVFETTDITNVVQDLCCEDAPALFYLYYDEDYPDGDFTLHLLTAHRTETIPPSQEEAKPKEQKDPYDRLFNIMEKDEKTIK